MKAKRRSYRRNRLKEMSRPARLASARAWLEHYEGKHILRSYRKRYGTCQVTTAIELRMLGYPIAAERIAEIKRRVAIQAENKRRSREAKVDRMEGERDAVFAFIAGHTSGGAPYGVTWEELKEARKAPQSETRL